MDLSQLNFADLSIKTQNKVVCRQLEILGIVSLSVQCLVSPVWIIVEAFSIKSPDFLWEFSEEVTFSIFQPQLINNDDDHDVGVLICNGILIHF